jgi:hypothetical protein
VTGPHRLDRNGIPVLDPPGQNRLRPSPCRIPSDHNFGPPIEIDSEEDYVMGYVSTCYEQKCRRCGTVDRYWRTIDPYAARAP